MVEDDPAVRDAKRMLLKAAGVSRNGSQISCLGPVQSARGKDRSIGNGLLPARR
jgi:hypothetical protein